jgi:hypothetical protein
VLAAMRAVVLELLDEAAPGVHMTEEVSFKVDEPAEVRAQVRRRLAACIRGEPADVHDGIFLYCHSLTTPFTVEDTPENQPPSLPPGVTHSAGGFRVADIELVWVPPVAAWLGDELAPGVIANPIREVSHAGFFIARRPLCDEHDQPVEMTFYEADEHCRELAARTGARVELPTADAWEIAARGTDGRRFPWGNALPKPSLEDASAWGMEDPVGEPQWVRDEAGAPLLVGGAQRWRCSVRSAPSDPAQQAAVRIVVPGAG